MSGWFLMNWAATDRPRLPEPIRPTRTLSFGPRGPCARARPETATAPAAVAAKSKNRLRESVVPDFVISCLRAISCQEIFRLKAEATDPKSIPVGPAESRQRVSAASEPPFRSGAKGPREGRCRGGRGAKPPGLERKPNLRLDRPHRLRP